MLSRASIRVLLPLVRASQRVAVSTQTQRIAYTHFQPCITHTTLNTTCRRSFSSSSASSVLVIAEHNNAKLNEATLQLVGAAQKLKAPVTVVVIGKDCAAVASEATKITGVSKVVLASDPAWQYGVAESVSPLIAALAKQFNASHVLAATSASGKNILPRVGAHLDVQPITDVIDIQSADTFVRPIYAGNAMATVQSKDAVKLLTVRPTSFEKATLTGSAGVEPSSVAATASTTKWLKDELTTSVRPELASARIVVSGGRGLKSKENFAIIEELADSLGAAVGASRAAVDAGYVPNDYQVGQTGKVVAPDLYIAVGISGAIQHLAGMKDSKVIVAINKDKEAAIFQVADYGLEADLFKAVPEMTAAIKQLKGK